MFDWLGTYLEEAKFPVPVLHLKYQKSGEPVAMITTKFAISTFDHQGKGGGARFRNDAGVGLYGVCTNAAWRLKGIRTTAVKGKLLY